MPKMVGLKQIQVLTFATVSIFMAGAQVPLCTPAEEQQPHTITLSNPGNQFVWSKDNTPIAICRMGVCPLYVNVTGYNASVSSNTTALFIFKVTRQDEGTYFCDDRPHNSCDLRVYAKPTSVSCQQPTLQADSVTVVCSVTRIYPNPVCQFVWIINSTESHSLPEQWITVDIQTEYKDPVYYNASCSLKLPAQNFSVGSHQFQAMVYPNVTGRNSDSAFVTNSSQTSPQPVVYPLVSLESCPITDTYVEEGKSFNCTCRETANSFILATTTLSYGSTNFRSTQNVTASFTANRTKGALSCEAQLPDGTKNSLTQTVKVAYGPKNVSMKVDQAENGVISLCDQPVTVTVTCSFPVNDTSPGVNFQLSSNLSDPQTGFSNMSAHNYTATRGGLFYFLCTANNSGISSLSANSTTIIQVTAPPSSPVIEKYQDGVTSVIVAGDQLTVQDGQVTRIRCRVEGGYPPVSALSLECGPQTNTSRGSNVYLDVNIDRLMDGSNCSCTATHNSSCYRNNKNLTVLDVHFGPTILSFEANNNSSKQIILDRNSAVNFSCQAEGNPSLRLFLKRNGAELQTFTDTSQKFNLTLNYSKPIADCLDAGVYMCLAEGGQRAKNKSVAVYVKCIQQLRDPDSLSKIHHERVNGTVLINIPVYGYPEPTLTLRGYKFNLSSNDYSLTYIKLEPPFGNVSLIINVTNAHFFQNYTVNINNDGGTLTYSFEIVDGDPVNSNSGNVDPPDKDVGAIVGGIVAAVLVIVIIFVIIFLWKRKGGPCKGEKPPNGSVLMDTAYGSDLSVNHHADSGDAEVTIDNSAIYSMGEKSLKSDEVTVDNSDLYNLNWRSDEVVVDNSDLYNLNHPTPGSTVRDSKYKNYSEVVPTITTATSLPLNMRNKKTEDTSSPYEDVSSGDKSKPKPRASQKPKPVAKPKPQTGKQSKSPPTDETYAMVVKVAKSDKPFAIKEETDDFFYNPSQQPEIPEKNFENPYEDTNNEKITEKKTPDRKKKNTGKPSGKASDQHNNPSSPGYTNGGFSNPEDEVNVYENT